jgi:hypothetical protein
MTYFKVEKVCICGFAEVSSPQITKDWVRKSQIHKVSHLRKVRKLNKLFKPANLWICDLRNLFADRPALLFSTSTYHNKRNK